jgi:hypothetical protein
MSISAMKQALEALEKLWDIIDDIDTYGDMAKSDDKLYRSLVERRQRQRFEQTGISTDGYELNGGAITALRQAIAEAEKQEPVAQCSYPKCQATNGCVGACSKTAPVHAIDISQERVDETAKREHDCNKCENRGRVLGDSQESYCENCIYGSPWKKDYYKEKNA